MKKVILIGTHGFMLQKETDVVVITSPTDSKTRLLYYKQELIPAIEELQQDNPNKKPLREGSKFIPLKKRR